MQEEDAADDESKLMLLSWGVGDCYELSIRSWVEPAQMPHLSCYHQTAITPVLPQYFGMSINNMECHLKDVTGGKDLVGALKANVGLQQGW